MHISNTSLLRRVIHALEAQNAHDITVEEGGTSVTAVVRCRIGELPLVVPIIPHRAISSLQLPLLLRSLQTETAQLNGMLVLGVANGDVALANSLLQELTRTTVLPIPTSN